MLREFGDEARALSTQRTELAMPTQCSFEYSIFLDKSVISAQDHLRDINVPV